MFSWYSRSIINKNITTLIKRNYIKRFIGPAMFFLGFFLIFVFGILDIWQGILASGIILGLGIIYFLTIPVRRRKIDKLDEVLSVILSHEIVYLYDDIFAGFSKSQRIKIARRLINSPNLNSYELIGGLALVRKALHLSEERVKSFLSAENFGLLSRISGGQLQIIESSKTIRSAEIECAKSKINFKQEKKFVWLHRNPYLKKDDSRVDTWIKQVPYKKYPLFFAGAAIAVSAILCFIVWDLSAWFFMLFFFGMAMAGSAYIFVPYVSWIKNSKSKIDSIKNEINNIDLLPISAKCFEGISLAKRELLVEKLIRSGKVPNRKLIHGLAIIDSSATLSEEEIRARLSDRRIAAQRESIKNSEKDVKTINITVKTNCPSCGAAYREGVNFCTSCGTIKKL